MITQSIHDKTPKGAIKKINIGSVRHVYFADDIEIITAKINREKAEKEQSVLHSYDKAERSLTVSKHEYYDLQAATLVDIEHKGKTKADTKKAFKDAVVARTTIQNKRDKLLSDIQLAETIEELNLINW